MAWNSLKYSPSAMYDGDRRQCRMPNYYLIKLHPRSKLHTRLVGEAMFNLGNFIHREHSKLKKEKPRPLPRPTKIFNEGEKKNSQILFLMWLRAHNQTTTDEIWRSRTTGVSSFFAKSLNLNLAHHHRFHKTAHAPWLQSRSKVEQNLLPKGVTVTVCVRDLV